MENTPGTIEAAPKTNLISVLNEELIRARKFLRYPEMTTRHVRIFFWRVRSHFKRLLGTDSIAYKSCPVYDTPLSKQEASEALNMGVTQIENYVASLTSAQNSVFIKPLSERVFIGHGRSPIWRELKDFLADRLMLPWDEFDRESVAGIATSERLKQMLNTATFAFLIMTAEDVHADTSLHARENVIHEIGLFQGKLGLHRAIVLFEKGCHEFSNIHGLTHIPFPSGCISATFENIRRVLEREQLIGSNNRQ